MMNKIDFDNKLSTCSTEKDLAVLADEVFEAINAGMDISLAKSFVQQLLDKGLNPASQPEENDDWLCINGLAYAYNDDVLDIARMIFNRCGVPKSFYSFIGTKIDYNYYNVPYVVKLYLLASSYLWETEETYIKMSGNLFEEMFTTTYTSLRPEHKKLTLTPDIFKEIEKYDFSVEMLPQEVATPKWVLHIFEKESKIEVARYE
jgi:hypothetical protein